MMNAIFLALQTSPKLKCEAHVYLPYSPAGAQVVKVASWTPSRGLTLNKNNTLFPEKYEDFQGSEVNVTVFPFSPYWMDVQQKSTDGGSISHKSGRDYLVVEALAAALNFSINVLPYREWEEVMSRLERREAFISPRKLAIMPHLQEIYDYSLFIERATLGFSMAKPSLKPRWQSLYYPLSGEVWASILASLILVLIILLPIEWLRWGRESGERKWSGKIVLELVVGVLLGQAYSRGLPSTSSTRLLVAAWLVFAFILGTAYRGNLTAFLTVPKYPARPENVEQLVASGARVTMPPDAVDFYDSFKTSDSPVLKTLSERVDFVPNHEVGMRQSLEMNKAYLYERLHMEQLISEYFTDASGTTRLYVARQNIMPGYCAYPLIRDAPFKHTLDRYILALHDAGLINKWTSDAREKARLEALQKMKEKHVGDVQHLGGGVLDVPARATMALTLVHLQGPLFLLLLGLLISAASFILEVLLGACC
ncbi:ionotropic receptor 21a-like [Cherax quadricarinatus]|uniref:ionotropic receptor 21a-like n=1 Tax=Cherax quadricarinatus TaxID=27406 RepID=UPI00387EAAD1